MKFIDEDGEPYHQIHEVYYDKDGHPNGYTENPVSVFSNEGIDGLSSVLEKMAEALKKPALEESDFAASVQSSIVTPVGGNVFLDLGFPVPEAVALKAESNNVIVQKLKIIAQNEKKPTRRAGSLKGAISIAADFDAPLTISAQMHSALDAEDEKSKS